MDKPDIYSQTPITNRVRNEYPVWKQLVFMCRSYSAGRAIYYICLACTKERRHPMPSLSKAFAHLEDLRTELALEIERRYVEQQRKRRMDED